MTLLEQPDAEVRRAAYEARLRTLSEASVHRHFDAFLDIAWDDPALAVRADDPRWVLPEADVLGRHPWYRALSLERRIAIGLYRQADIAKVGLQFEQVLVSGLMAFAAGRPNGSAEFRYATHEATEECHHTQMFQELVNRTGADVAGAGPAFRALAPYLPLFARWAPVGFFIGVLAGEEPIDHLQKAILRSGQPIHPLLERVMAIHVAEEARHIGFAHTYVAHRAPQLGRVQRHLVALAFPVVMRVLCDQIVVPSRRARRDLGLPRSVVRELWYRDPASRRMLRDLFADVRALAEDTGLVTPLSKRVWRLLGIDGPTSRFRGEPAPSGR